VLAVWLPQNARSELAHLLFLEDLDEFHPFNGFAGVFGSPARMILFACIIGITIRISGH
jgi:hypothetical protein